MSDTGLREDIERLKRVFERELEAQVEVEEVDPDRFRITVVSKRFAGMRPLQRQDFLWDIVDRELERERTLAITLIFAFDPTELQAA